MNVQSKIPLTIILLLIAAGAFYVVFFARDTFPLPSGTTELLEQNEEAKIGEVEHAGEVADNASAAPSSPKTVTSRDLFITDGTKHSIPLDEILSGGPGKDGIPSIDEPKFINVAEASSFLENPDPGIGLVVDGESRFYPYRILVWHEIVNDTVAGTPVLVTYCPLCATGIVFRREVDGVASEFGVSGMLWQSNLLMYNRADKESDESLWSQVLGEAVVGVHTGKKLAIVPSDIIRWEDWKKLHPDTVVLSSDTGAFRDYGRDPYGDYYTSDSVSFGAQFTDTRLHPKAFVIGIELDGVFKAYHVEALAVGETKDSFAGHDVVITKDEAGRIDIRKDGTAIAQVPGFWFSWVAVHPETELFK